MNLLTTYCLCLLAVHLNDFISSNRLTADIPFSLCKLLFTLRTRVKENCSAVIYGEVSKALREVFATISETSLQRIAQKILMCLKKKNHDKINLKNPLNTLHQTMLSVLLFIFIF